jgi:hypothetical protein
MWESFFLILRNQKGSASRNVWEILRYRFRWCSFAFLKALKLVPLPKAIRIPDAIKFTTLADAISNLVMSPISGSTSRRSEWLSVIHSVTLTVVIVRVRNVGASYFSRSQARYRLWKLGFVLPGSKLFAFNFFETTQFISYLWFRASSIYFIK